MSQGQRSSSNPVVAAAPRPSTTKDSRGLKYPSRPRSKATYARNPARFAKSIAVVLLLPLLQ